MDKTWRIIIVDDDENMIKLIQKMLQMGDYSITSVLSSGEVAVETVTSNNCDLLIMDIKLGGKINGIEAASRINTRHEIPVVFITGQEDEELFKQAKHSLTYGYLLKPFTIREMQIAVELALYKHESSMKMRSQELYLENILDTMNDCLVVINQEGKVINSNRSLCTLLGYNSSELNGKEIGHFCIGKDNSACTIEQLLDESDINKQVELVFKTSNGEKIPMLGSFSRLSSDAGRNGIICTATDIRQLKDTEFKLKQVSEGFTGIVDDSIDGIMVLDEDGTILYANNTVRIYFGNDDIVNQKFDREIGTSDTQEIDIYRLDWGIGTALVNIKEITWQGKAARLAVMRDITDYKRKEEKLEMVNLDLQKANDIITTIMKDLKTARDEAQAATTSKSEFLAKMSHEIRTPLNMIISSTRLLQETSLHQDQRKYLDMIYYSSDALLSLIEDILDLSKIEANKLQLEHIEYDLWQTVERTVDIFSINAYKKGLELSVLIHDDVPQFVKGDPFRLRQVLINLIGNALKFTVTGEIIVIIELFSISDESVSLRFEVKDTGIGISSENKQKLFQLFSQLEQTRTSKFAGTGLGLSITKHLVELMGGQVKVESQQGVGSTFWFTIQLDRSSRISPTAMLPEDLFSGKKVLLIEDNATVRNTVGYYLRGFNCSIDEITNADEAMQLINPGTEDENQKWDLVIIDYTLTSTDGLTLASNMENQANLADTPKILLSSQLFRRKNDRKKLNTICDALIIKPIKRIQLLRTMAKVLGHQLEIDWEPFMQNSKASERIDYKRELLNGKQILVAEDNESNQMIIQSIIEKSGCNYTAAYTGQEVLDKILVKRFDMIFMDINMPEMNGYDTTRKLREIGNTIPIIALTASALKEEINLCLDSGMNDVISKPYTPQQLIDTIAAYTAGCEKPAPGKDMTRDNAVFKYESLLNSLAGEKERVLKIISIFLKGLTGKIENIENSIQTNDLESIQSDAHFIKGSARSLTALEIGNFAEDLESAAKNEDLDGVKKNYSRLVQSQADFISHLKESGIELITQ
jgi:two-component system sensor histidine kinase/response regulator